MKHLPIGTTTESGKWRWSGAFLSLLLHASAAAALLALQVPEAAAVRRWMEMAVTEPREEPARQPPPPPEAPSPASKPRAVQHSREVMPPELTPPPPDLPTQSLHRVQGLSSSSFLPGTGTGLAVRAGTTLSAPATDETVGVDQASVPWSAASVAPKCPKPHVEVPPSFKAAGVEGSVEIMLDIDADGQVVGAKVSRPLSPDADAACLSAWRASRCKPARQGESRVAVTGLSHTCTFRVIE